MDTNYPHPLFLEQHSGDSQESHSGQFKKQQFTGDLFPRLLFRRVCPDDLRGAVGGGPQQGQRVVRPVAVNVFRSGVKYHTHSLGAGIQPYAVGVGEQGSVHSFQGCNGMN